MATPCAPELRGRIHALRREIELLTVGYHEAKVTRHPEQAGTLLRKRSELTRELFETQRELLLLFRKEVADASVAGWAESNVP